MVKKKARKKKKSIPVFDICPFCNSPMDTKTGKYGQFKVCSKRICGYIPSHREIRKQMDIRKKVSRLMDKKRKQGKII